MKLRLLEDKDAPLMLEWMHNKQINVNFRFDFNTMTIENVLEFINNSSVDETNHNFAIVDDSDEYLGTISLKNVDMINKNAEYAIVLRQKCQGKGIAKIATNLIIAKAFDELGLHRVYLNVFEDNLRANRFYQKMGFTYEGCSKECLLIDDQFKSLNWYAKVKE